MNNKLYVALSSFSKFSPLPLQLIKNSDIPYSLNGFKRRLLEHEIVSEAFDATGIIAGIEPYSRDVLSKLPNLKYISRAGVGIDNIDLEYAQKKAIKIFNTPFVVIRPVVELTIAMIYDLLRKITFHTGLIKQGKWEKAVGNTIYQKNIGIIGTGRIGKALAETLTKLDANIFAYDLFKDEIWANKNRIKYLSLSKLLRESDIISIHASGSESNSAIIGKSEFNLIKKGAILINTSRGSNLDEKELVKNLENGKLAGFGSDVFINEPYSGELIKFENVVLTPHVATFTVESRNEMEIEATNNLLNKII